MLRRQETEPRVPAAAPEPGRYEGPLTPPSPGYAPAGVRQPSSPGYADQTNLKYASVKGNQPNILNDMNKKLIRNINRYN